MKKHTAFVYTLICALTISGCASGQAVKQTSLADLPPDYSLEQAREDGCVIYEDSDITSGQEQWNEFVATVDAGKEAAVRLAFFYTLDPDRCDPDYYESEKDNYPLLFIQDLTFDGTAFTISWYEDGREITESYSYLMQYENAGYSYSSTSYSSYICYVLTDDDTATWGELVYGAVSSIQGDYIRHHVVYTDFVYN